MLKWVRSDRFGHSPRRPTMHNSAQFCPIVHNWGRKILEARFRRPQPALVVRRILTPMNWVPLTTTRRWRAKRAPPRYNLERSEGTRTAMSRTATLRVAAVDQPPATNHLGRLGGADLQVCAGAPRPPPPRHAPRRHHNPAP